MMNFLHGGDVYGSEILLDFSANINPLGMPENVKNILKNSVSDWEKYPDPYCGKLIKKISERENFPEKNIVCGNGAADLIYKIVQALKPPNTVICAPSFSEYEKALREFGGKITLHFLSEENNFSIDKKILECLNNSVDMLILCTPNNPTGKTIDMKILKEICEKCLENNIIFLCDECFLDFVIGGENMSAKNFINKNIIVLKAFTKIYAMAGLRLGYALFGSSEIAGKVRKIGQFWSVSAPAQIAGIAALNEENYIRKTIEIIETEREFLSKELQKLNFKIFPSEANFILFKSKLPLDKLLLKNKILIRNCGNFVGLDENFFRIAVRNHEENTALINALRSVKNG
ncbi:MAG: aminotransferase class I/II-fold pyridoxal phosphate-dependent enzyme [Ruminococcus sp.]|nr:aminotransferase class I/II-fold pyridoxal phosphate-dependent enzyme [Ruminococcus sp.]MCM1381356.1 aminotransferase class I/II-fold pyridoxal phosphate-dependent enzyme [Muribaculaceae bacterium]MCM1479581.1 aminotransferase class I/II-fold pyridoxal phosphate-dependent enzyme [Muribaculaceae bacterium]